MSRIIGVLNYKGGTGKTTTVVNLAAGLAQRGARILCVDLDAQGSLATYLGVKYEYSLTHLVLHQVFPQDCIVSTPAQFDLIPSDRSLLSAEGFLWRMGDNHQARQILAQRMQEIEDTYDFVLLDHSPSANLLGENGLVFADEIIIPVAMNYLALVGARQVIRTLQEIRQSTPSHVRFSMIVPTFFYRRLRKDREVLSVLQRYFGGKISRPIRANVKIAEASSHQMSIFEYAPHSAGAQDYAALVEQIAGGQEWVQQPEPAQRPATALPVTMASA